MDGNEGLRGKREEEHRKFIIKSRDNLCHTYRITEALS